MYAHSSQTHRRMYTLYTLNCSYTHTDMHTYRQTFMHAYIQIYIQFVHPYVTLYYITRHYSVYIALAASASEWAVTASPASLTLADSPAAVAKCHALWRGVARNRRRFCWKSSCFSWCPFAMWTVIFARGKQTSHNHIPKIPKRGWSSQRKHGRLHGLLDPLIILLLFVRFLWFYLPSCYRHPIFTGILAPNHCSQNWFHKVIAFGWTAGWSQFPSSCHLTNLLHVCSRLERWR